MLSCVLASFASGRSRGVLVFFRNVGYIDSFWKKIESGERIWDSTSDRKAGGVPLKRETDHGCAAFVVANATSVMALVRAVCGHVMRSNSCPPPLARAFCSLRVTWLLPAQVPRSNASP